MSGWGDRLWPPSATPSPACGPPGSRWQQHLVRTYSGSGRSAEPGPRSWHPTLPVNPATSAGIVRPGLEPVLEELHLCLLEREAASTYLPMQPVLVVVLGVGATGILRREVVRVARSASQG